MATSCASWRAWKNQPGAPRQRVLELVLHVGLEDPHPAVSALQPPRPSSRASCRGVRDSGDLEERRGGERGGSPRRRSPGRPRRRHRCGPSAPAGRAPGRSLGWLARGKRRIAPVDVLADEEHVAVGVAEVAWLAAPEGVEDAELGVHRRHLGGHLVLEAAAPQLLLEDGEEVELRVGGDGCARERPPRRRRAGRRTGRGSPPGGRGPPAGPRRPRRRGPAHGRGSRSAGRPPRSATPRRRPPVRSRRS